MLAPWHLPREVTIGRVVFFAVIGALVGVFLSFGLTYLMVRDLPWATFEQRTDELALSGSYSTGLTSGAVLGTLIGVTVWYARAAHEMTKEARRSRLAQMRPVLVLRQQPGLPFPDPLTELEEDSKNSPREAGMVSASQPPHEQPGEQTGDWDIHYSGEAVNVGNGPVLKGTVTMRVLLDKPSTCATQMPAVQAGNAWRELNLALRMHKEDLPQPTWAARGFIEFR